MGTEQHVVMMHVQRPAQCACGELLRAGERAGQLDADPTPVCLWCLADVQAGRPRPRRRQATTQWPEPLALVSPGSSGAYGPAATPAAGPSHGSVWSAPPVPLHGVSGDRGRRSHDGRPRTVITLLITVLVMAALLVAVLELRGGLVPSLAGAAPKDDPRAYAFMNSTPTGAPVTWDPCLPIHMVVNSAAAPPGADGILEEAAARVSGATGLKLEVTGPTTQAPMWDVTARELASGRPGTSRAPVLVAWTTPEQIPGLKGSVVGLGGPIHQYGSPLDRAKYIGGTVYLDGPQLAQILRRPDGHAQARAVVMHELGHLVGLNHVDNQAEIMAPRSSSTTEFGLGDRAGLTLLGSGGCPYATDGSPAS